MGKGGAVFCFFLAFICILALIGLIFYGFYVSYQYEKVIGSYMSNAVDMVAPEQMLEQVKLAKQGMVDEGLTEDLYGAWIFKKPSNSMKFQYQHIDGIIERINSVIEWKQKVYGNQSQSAETLGDVYETKMTNLRNYINGETSESISSARSDWIASDVWWIKNHFALTYFGWVLGLILIILIIVFFIIGGAIYNSY